MSARLVASMVTYCNCAFFRVNIGLARWCFLRRWCSGDVHVDLARVVGRKRAEGGEGNGAKL